MIAASSADALSASPDVATATLGCEVPARGGRLLRAGLATDGVAQLGANLKLIEVAESTLAAMPPAVRFGRISARGVPHLSHRG